MQVKLLEHIIEGNNVKTSVRRMRGEIVPFVKGAVIDVSEATGRKYIKKGWAEEFKPEPKGKK